MDNVYVYVLVVHGKLPKRVYGYTSGRSLAWTVGECAAGGMIKLTLARSGHGRVTRIMKQGRSGNGCVPCCFTRQCPQLVCVVGTRDGCTQATACMNVQPCMKRLVRTSYKVRLSCLSGVQSICSGGNCDVLRRYSVCGSSQAQPKPEGVQHCERWQRTYINAGRASTWA